MKKALVIGINDYPNSPLDGCENDALAIATLLERNGDGSPNFSVRTLSSGEGVVTSERMIDEITELFRGDAETAVLYFAGHGLINAETNSGYIVSQDGKRGSWGVALSEVLTLANTAYPRISASVIILDSCHSGYAGEVAGLPAGQASVIGNGVTILTASHREGVAADGAEHGLFTAILLDGLSGGASDIRGNVTPAALYSHVDQTLGPWEQRPIYKANVQTFITLRQVTPKVAPEILRRLPEYFPNSAYVFPLDPSYEPDRENIPEALRPAEVNDAHTRVFKELQQCNRVGLVVPVDADHMYYAAIQSTGCRLTALGAHYRNLATLGRI